MHLATNGGLWYFTFSLSVVGKHEEIRENFYKISIFRRIRLSFTNKNF